MDVIPSQYAGITVATLDLESLTTDVAKVPRQATGLVLYVHEGRTILRLAWFEEAMANEYWIFAGVEGRKVERIKQIRAEVTPIDMSDGEWTGGDAHCEARLGEEVPAERYLFLDRRLGQFFRHGEAELFLALRDGRVVGRISAQVDPNFNAYQENAWGMFGFLEVEEDREALKLDNLKRKYHNAIGRLPYGIPSSELKDMEWIELASALTTGPKKTVGEGREVTEIHGRWYYSDMEDTSSFLKEHGARFGEKESKSSVHTDKETLLATLEERFILGEITEETYDTRTLKLGFRDPVENGGFSFLAGQFGEFSVFGEGECTFCISSPPTRPEARSAALTFQVPLASLRPVRNEYVAEPLWPNRVAP